MIGVSRKVRERRILRAGRRCEGDKETMKRVSVAPRRMRIDRRAYCDTVTVTVREPRTAIKVTWVRQQHRIETNVLSQLSRLLSMLRGSRNYQHKLYLYVLALTWPKKSKQFLSFSAPAPPSPPPTAFRSVLLPPQYFAPRDQTCKVPACHSDEFGDAPR